MPEKHQTYLFSYYHDGAWWNLELPGTSREDAEERLAKLPHAQYDGELMAKIPAAPGARVLARFWCWVRNRMAPAR